MELEQAQKRVEELRAVIEKNNRLYYDQDAPELEVVAENAAAVRLYEAAGFREYGRNPRGFLSRRGWQELVLMRLELDR